MEKEKPLGMRIGESVFSAGYLAFAFVAAIVFLTRAAGGGANAAYALTCGIMTLLLGCGDAFHLVPRIVANLRGPAQDDAAKRRRAFWLGLGNLVSSITMTVFYVLLFVALWQQAHPEPGATMGESESFMRAALLLLATVRIVLCLLPQNRWFAGGSQRWGIYRNVPFVLMGLVTIGYLLDWYGQWLMALLVAASFACYLGVVLFARRRPMMGMLMIPKTLCYIALICLLL